MSLQYSNKLQIGATLPQVGVTRRQARASLHHPRANLRHPRAILRHPLLRALLSGENKSERFESVVAPELFGKSLKCDLNFNNYKDCHPGLDPASIKAC